eukprot:CAMPEP_0194537484 /NCGR_PEP_ID=MMETSP0253-20130528/76763_1 /TAXON_ID=2966 /ORGANISM="Noctiluca scintillans" /LENGTH=57 /DNA_ID=CAMNT_0039383511 /DNA_START=86 /DNA_END=259 /DNA_ORIENTATION=+
MSAVQLVTPPEGSALQREALSVRNIIHDKTINRSAQRCTESGRETHPVSCKTFQNAG